MKKVMSGEWMEQSDGGRITRDQIKAAARKERARARDYSEYLAALGVLAGHHGGEWRAASEERRARVARMNSRLAVFRSRPLNPRVAFVLLVVLVIGASLIAANLGWIGK